MQRLRTTIDRDRSVVKRDTLENYSSDAILEMLRSDVLRLQLWVPPKWREIDIGFRFIKLVEDNPESK